MQNEGKIISCITIFEVNIKVGDKTYVVGGIGDVCTAESHRCKNYSGKLLDYCINYMKEQHYELSMLHASIVKYHSHYGKFGYKDMRLWNYNIIYDDLKSLKMDLKEMKGKYEEISIDDSKDELLKMHRENRKFYKLTIDYEKNNYFEKWVKSEVTEMNEKKESKIFSYIEDGVIKGSIAMMINKENESEIEVMIKLLLLKNEGISSNELKEILMGLLYENSVKLGITNNKRIIFKVPEILCKMCDIKKDDNEKKYKIEEEYDDGWMYRIIDDKMSKEDIEIINENHENVVFRIDNF